jgi:ABC-2 type transport system ATP-binding protein
MNVLTSHGLTKTYRKSAALIDCELTLPEGSVVAIVGPNGAGKTTLLHLATGLLEPTSGSISILGDLQPGCLEALRQVAFVAQDTPLHQFMTVKTMLNLTEALNGAIDEEFALGRFRELSIPLSKKVGKLSGGQKAQVALTLAIARRPRLLVLDEPTASLDPLARFEMLGLLMAEVARTGMSVLFSSHSLSDLERVSDYLVLLAHGTVHLAAPIDQILETHRFVTGPRVEVGALSGCEVIELGLGSEVGHHLVRVLARGALATFSSTQPSLEEIVLAYLRRYQAPLTKEMEVVR